jgi:hypothetical protein
MLIGDFGPEGENGEMSLQAVRDLGLGINGHYPDLSEPRMGAI